MSALSGMSMSDLATTAVACISAATVWATFWSGHREKERERRQRRLGELERLRIRLRDDLQPWAENQYAENAHNIEWYKPDWRVNPFPRDYVEGFNRLVMDGDYPASLTAGLVRLEDAARRFHDMLVVQEASRRREPRNVRAALSTIIAASRNKKAGLTAEELKAHSGNTDETGQEWIRDYYERHRAIHVDLIGRAGAAGGLHEEWRSVCEELERTRLVLRAVHNPWWSMAGHVLAVVFCGIGLWFLFQLGDSIARGGARPPSATQVESAPRATPEAASLPTDSLPSPAPDSGK